MPALCLRYVRAASDALPQGLVPSDALTTLVLRRLREIHRLCCAALGAIAASFVAGCAQLRKALFVPFYLTIVAAVSRLRILLEFAAHCVDLAYRALREVLDATGKAGVSR